MRNEHNKPINHQLKLKKKNLTGSPTSLKPEFFEIMTSSLHNK